MRERPEMADQKNEALERRCDDIHDEAMSRMADSLDTMFEALDADPGADATVLSMQALSMLSTFANVRNAWAMVKQAKLAEKLAAAEGVE